MCRNIKTLFNFEPPATDEEIRASSVQFVRKLSGYNTPSKANEAAFEAAIEEVFQAARRLMVSLETSAAPRDRESEAERARRRAAERYGHQAPAFPDLGRQARAAIGDRLARRRGPVLGRVQSEVSLIEGFRRVHVTCPHAQLRQVEHRVRVHGIGVEDAGKFDRRGVQLAGPFEGLSLSLIHI